MPLLDIATSQPSFRNHLGASRDQPLLCGNISSTLTFGKGKRLAYSWKVSFQIPRKVNFNVRNLEMQGALLIKAVATLEPKYLIQSEDGHKDGHNFQFKPGTNPQVFQSESSIEDSMETDERERLRRMRISKANKGNVPWNKGRKHSAETRKRIKERTKLAMQDPKVKMKLINLGHAQSEETRIKIGVGVRIGWQRRREKLMVQETCYFEWQNLIAEASRRGYAGEEQLHWDSYKILDEQLEQEWFESIEYRKSMPRVKGSKRAPKSLEQRRKISEAISAKWTDPGYRDRVCSALAKYHGIPVGTERKERKMSSGTRKSRAKTKPSEPYNSAVRETKSQIRSRLKRRSGPSYKDPLVNSKLEMIKKIRAERAAMDTKKRDTMERAKLLIAEAEKAAKALEVVATKSPLARASLIETKKLIAEATRSIEAIETGQVTALDTKNGTYPSFEPIGLINQFDKETDTQNGDLNQADNRELNGFHVLPSGNNNSEDFDFGKPSLHVLLNCGEEPLPCTSSGETSYGSYVSPPLLPDSLVKQADPADHQVVQLELNEAIAYERTPQPNGAKTDAKKTEMFYNSSTLNKKKWISGRLVDVEEED
ncbi:hypothetical protein HHK36_028785 [Tetracentron sinense]|uniref:Nuclease associated modular domain-containing protein n=1 Tax=Tetracentron sinense TaxID=13715 RepID=A0A834YG11_TETSI|nr:hypothetical protein HHK36_028785 [Tetracentron sinense]